MVHSDIAPALTRADSIKGAYELAFSAARNQLFIAATPDFGDDQPGVLHVYDPDTLTQIRQITLPKRAFALALDDASGRLYIGHTLDGALSVVDAASGDLLSTVALGQPGPEGKPEHTRMVRLDPARGLAMITSPSGPGLLWIVDLATGTIRHRIEAGPWRAGAAYDAEGGILWTSGGGAEEITGWDVVTGAKRGGITTGDTAEGDASPAQHFFVNLALDAAGQRLFATDSLTGALYAFDSAGAKVIGKTDIGIGALDVAFNPIRDEIYVTWRGDSRDQPGGTGGLAVLDGQSLAIRHRLDLPAHPNSIEIAPDGHSLWLTVKLPYADSHPAWRAHGMDSVLRVDLTKLPAAT